MIRNLIIYIARKKNPLFSIESNVSSSFLLSFLLSKTCAFIRGLRILFSGKRPVLLFLGRGVKIRGGSYIHLGKIIQIEDHVSINAFGRHGLFIGNNVWIGSHSMIKVSFSFNDPGDFIRIGNNAGIGEYAHLGGAGGLEIGNDCIIGPYFSCHPENHNYFDNELLIRKQGTTRKGIKIGNNCWIGAKVTILDGVTIGDDCVIAAGAVVTKNMEGGSVIGGVPARVIKKRNAITESHPLRVA